MDWTSCHKEPLKSRYGCRKRSTGGQRCDPWDNRSGRSPDDYRGFIRGSKAEFAIPKSGYVAARCGWFSDRSVCYLASGRPVVAQETGFSDYLPTGRGLFAFESAAEAAEQIRHLNADYDSHARASRRLAAEFFDSDKVLRRLLRLVGVAP